MSQASTATVVARVEQGVAAGEQGGDRAAVPRVLAGERHRPVGRHRVADHDDLGGVDHRVERPGQQGPAVQLDGRLVGAVEPGGDAAGQHHRAERATLAPIRPRLQSLAVRASLLARCARETAVRPVSMLSVTVVQEASGLDPAGNRARLHDLVPSDSDLVVLPEAFARDFGEAGSDVSAYAEAARRRVRHRAGRGRRRAQHHRGRRDVRDQRGPRPPLQHAARRAGPSRRRTGRSTSTTPSATGSPTRCTPDRWRRWWSTSPGSRVGLMTCYDLRFPELARAARRPRRRGARGAAAWVAGPRKVEHWRTLVRARAIENTVFVVAAGQPGPRYTGHSMVVDPLGDVLAEAGEGAEVLRATLDRSVLDQARRTNPSLANRQASADLSVTCSVVPRTAPRRRATRHERVKVRSAAQPSGDRDPCTPTRAPREPVHQEIVPATGRRRHARARASRSADDAPAPVPAARRAVAARRRRRPGRPGGGPGAGRPVAGWTASARSPS